MIPGTLFRQERIGVHLSKPLISSVRFQHSFCSDLDMGILEKLEIMFLSLGKGQRNNLSTFEVNQNLRL